MTSWSDFDKYLKAEHLKGRRVVATIVEMTVDEVHAPSGTAEEPVLWFQESKHGLIVSNTNRKALQRLFGDDVAACIGKRVYLEAEEMVVAKRLVHPIRIVGSPDVPTVATHGPAAAGAAAATQPAVKRPADSAPSPAPQDAVQPGPAAPATTRAPGPRPAAAESASAGPPATPADKEFDALPSQGEELRAAHAAQAAQAAILAETKTGVPVHQGAAAPPAGAQPPKRRAATVDPAAIQRWQDATEKFADDFPRFRLGRAGDQVDRLTLLYIVNDLGHPRVTLDNLDQVLAELRDHEQARAAQE